MSGSASSANKIVKPGYHIRPKYDLHGLRRRRSSDSKGHVAGELPLTSMIDMFSILVIYLLMNFSATGDVFFESKGLPLPKAAATSELQNAPLLSIVEQNFTVEAPPEFDGGGAVSDASPDLAKVVAQLKNLKQTATAKNLPNAGRINIQASEDAQIGDIKRAMTAAVNAGWGSINFVVEKTR